VGTNEGGRAHGCEIHGVDQKVDTKTTEIDSRVTDLDRNTERGISDAQSRADSANQAAQKADQAAQGAQQTADKGVSEATQAQQEIDNIDTYQQVKAETVLFRLNSSELTDEGKQKLDSIAQSLSSMKHYVIDVKGFTDKTGSKQYNLELSERRADAVVRYLTEDAHVPLVKVHVLGYGVDDPVADNHSRDGRKQNRRVEVEIMAPQMAVTSQAQSTPTPGTP
jgi:OmpA-OmpF porin, OOP family